MVESARCARRHAVQRTILRSVKEGILRSYQHGYSHPLSTEIKRAFLRATVGIRRGAACRNQHHVSVFTFQPLFCFGSFAVFAVLTGLGLTTVVGALAPLQSKKSAKKCQGAIWLVQIWRENCLRHPRPEASKIRGRQKPATGEGGPRGLLTNSNQT